MTSAEKMVCRGIMGFMVLALLTASQTEAIPCDLVISKLMPCKDYLVGKAAGVTSPCCKGADDLMHVISTPEPGLCFCLKKAASEFHVLGDRAKALPALCKLNLPSNNPFDTCTKLIGGGRGQ